MGTMADGLADGMALSAARRAESAASAAEREADTHRRKARDAEDSASRSKDMAFALAAKVGQLDAAYCKAQTEANLLHGILRAVHDIVEELPFEVGQHVRAKIIQKSRARLDDEFAPTPNTKWDVIAKELYTVKQLGIA